MFYFTLIYLLIMTTGKPRQILPFIFLKYEFKPNININPHLNCTANLMPVKN